MSTSDCNNKIVRLNVGGTRYDVSRDTLERCKDSMLASLISDHWKEGNANDSETIFIEGAHWEEGNSDDNGSIVVDRVHEKVGNADEPIFIDRNGLLFQYVLDYLRDGEVHLPSSVSKAALQKEFEFYGIHVDTAKVHEKYGFEHYHSLLEKFDELDGERIANQTSALVESMFWKAKTPRSLVSVEIPMEDGVLLYNHQAKFRERLLDRGLLLSSMCKKGSGYNAYVVKANT